MNKQIKAPEIDELLDKEQITKYRNPENTPINPKKHTKKFLELFKDVPKINIRNGKGYNECVENDDKTEVLENIRIANNSSPVWILPNYNSEGEEYSKKEEIDTFNMIVIDIDVEKHDKVKNGEEMKELLSEEVIKLRKRDKFNPLIACSGNGFHLYLPVPRFKLDEVEDFDKKLILFSQKLESLTNGTDIRVTNNYAKPIRVPGTINNKDLQRFFLNYNLDKSIEELRESNEELINKIKEFEVDEKDFKDESVMEYTKEDWKRNLRKEIEKIWEKGKRNYITIAISGFGARRQLPKKDIKKIMKVVWKNQDSEPDQWQNREEVINKTYRKHANDEKVAYRTILKEYTDFNEEKVDEIVNNWIECVRLDLEEKIFSDNKMSWDCETKFITFTETMGNVDNIIEYGDTYELPKKVANKMIEKGKAGENVWICKECGEHYYQKIKPTECKKEECDGSKFTALHPTESHEIGDTLLENYHFITPTESISGNKSGKIHIYKNGIYKSEAAKGTIRSKVKEINHISKKTLQKHVIDHIATMENVFETEIGLKDSKVILKDGVLDLETLEMEPHNPEYYALSRINIEYNKEKECSKFDEYLEEVIPNKRDQKRLQEFLGTALVNEKMHKKGVILVGPTDAGKSTFIEIFRSIFEKENVAAQSPSYLSNTRWGKAKLRGQLLNAVDEISPDKLKKLEVLKRILDGKKVEAEEKGEKTFEFTPTCEHIYAANQTPKADRTDDAFWNRWIVIEMPETIPENKQDEDLPDKILEEREGVFNWLVEGYKDFMENDKKFTHTIDWKKSRDKWLKWGNSIQRFIQKKIVKDKGNKISCEDLYGKYSKWVNKHQNLKTQGQKKLTRKVKKLSYAIYSDNYRFDGEQKSGFKHIKVIGGGGGGTSKPQSKINKDNTNTNNEDVDDSTPSSPRSEE